MSKDQFLHRILYLLGARLDLAELKGKYIEARYKKTMLSLPQKERQQICAHPEQHYPKYMDKWNSDWEKLVMQAQKQLKLQEMESIMIRATLHKVLAGTGIRFHFRHQDETIKIWLTLPRKKEVAYTLKTPRMEQVEAIARQVIAFHRQNTPLDPTAKVMTRSPYAVWEE